MKHQKTVAGKTPKQLARLVASLHYEALMDFYSELSDCLDKDGFADLNRGRRKLARALVDASYHTIVAAGFIKDAWKISKPFMKD